MIVGVLLVDVSELSVESAISLDGGQTQGIDNSGLLIYRKTDSDFNVLSRLCTHEGDTIGEFE